MIKNVDVSTLNSLVAMANASNATNFVMVPLNAKMDLMKVTKIVVSKSSHSTTTKNVAANKVNSNARTVIVSKRSNTVMVLLNAQMDLMKVTNFVASEVSRTTSTNNVDAIQRQKLLVLMDNASKT
jgi:hypothetical protein